MILIQINLSRNSNNNLYRNSNNNLLRNSNNNLSRNSNNNLLNRLETKDNYNIKEYNKAPKLSY